MAGMVDEGLHDLCRSHTLALVQFGVPLVY